MRKRKILSPSKEGKIPRLTIKEAVAKVKYGKHKSSCHGAKLAVFVNPKTEEIRIFCQACASYCKPVKKEKNEKAKRNKSGTLFSSPE